MTQTAKFGTGDASYLAAGAQQGISDVVDLFYDNMRTFSEATDILAMHKDDLSLSREKLKVFLAGWLGGPRHYAEKFGPIGIPRVHKHLDIGEKERDAWLLCMQKAVDKQPWSADFKTYFMGAIFVPAERVRQVCQSKSAPGLV